MIGTLAMFTFGLGDMPVVLAQPWVMAFLTSQPAS